MKKHIFLIILAAFLTFLLLGLVLFRFRSRPFITRLTDNYWVFTTINQLAKITDIPFAFYQFYPNKLSTYQLFIKGQDLEALQSQLPDVNQSNIAVDFNQVPAGFITDAGKTLKTRVRYRGNTSVHWAYYKKSWRINLRGNDALNQLKSIDLIIPEDRGLVLEHLANYRAKKLGLLNPDSWFINLIINQKSQGVYYATEKIDENFILKRDLQGTLFGEKDDLDNWNTSIYSSISRWRTYPENPHHPDFKYLKQLINMVNNQNTTIEELLTLIDLDNFLSWQVHSLLMASFAQEDTRNNRLFYNYDLKKFQFIPWDTGSRHESSEDLGKSYHPIVDRLLADPNIKAKRNQLLKSYITNPQNLSDDLAFFNKSIDQLYSPLMQDNLKFYANIKYLMDIKNYRNWMLGHFDNLEAQL